MLKCPHTITLSPALESQQPCNGRSCENWPPPCHWRGGEQVWTSPKAILWRISLFGVSGSSLESLILRAHLLDLTQRLLGSSSSTHRESGKNNKTQSPDITASLVALPEGAKKRLVKVLKI